MLGLAACVHTCGMSMVGRWARAPTVGDLCLSVCMTKGILLCWLLCVVVGASAWQLLLRVNLVVAYAATALPDALFTVGLAGLLLHQHSKQPL